VTATPARKSKAVAFNAIGNHPANAQVGMAAFRKRGDE
jgi:hypothetical protein